MEDQVRFKAYTFWREDDDPEVRRFGMDKSVATNFKFLNAKLQDVYPGLKKKTYYVSWKDEDDDDVMMSSDEELRTALESLKGDIIRLFVYCKGDSPKGDCAIVITSLNVTPNEASTSSSAPVHHGVVCDHCDTVVVGFRYKCTICEDFDLCSKCEAAGLHPEHCMMRMPNPGVPRAVIKAAIKRSRNFLKSYSTANAFMTEDHPFKKYRCERTDRRRHNSRESGEQGASDRMWDQRRKHRTSWLDTFATYMNEFANLAGDIDLDDGRNRGAAAAGQATATAQASANVQAATNAQETKSQTQSKTKSAQAPKQPKAGTSASTRPACPVLPINVEQLIDMMKSYVNSAPIGACPASNNTFSAATNNTANSAPSTSASAPQQTKDEEMGQGDRKSPEAGASVKVETDSSVSSNDSKDGYVEKADDWTVINNEKDLMDTTNAPIGFNLPQEFQDRVRINDGGLYPPLNTSTAVLNPKEAEVLKPVQAPATAPPAAAATPTPLQQQAAAAASAPPQPRQHHPKPHINAAIEHMLTMGFTNDGGWLTQLLESKDGNIAAVLDLLTPVNPKK